LKTELSLLLTEAVRALQEWLAEVNSPLGFLSYLETSVLFPMDFQAWRDGGE
jgi:hypothetical protein